MAPDVASSVEDTLPNVVLCMEPFSLLLPSETPAATCWSPRDRGCGLASMLPSQCVLLPPEDNRNDSSLCLGFCPTQDTHRMILEPRGIEGEELSRPCPGHLCHSMQLVGENGERCFMFTVLLIQDACSCLQPGSPPNLGMLVETSGIPDSTGHSLACC